MNVPVEVVACPLGGAVSEVRERPPSILKTSMTDPLGGDAGGLGAPTNYLEDIDGRP
jgi:hypothetical protein